MARVKRTVVLVVRRSESSGWRLASVSLGDLEAVVQLEGGGGEVFERGEGDVGGGGEAVGGGSRSAVMT